MLQKEPDDSVAFVAASLRILGILTARGGSKGIPRKNIVPLAGKPLLGYMLKAAQGSRLTRVIVSTDDKEIATIAKNLGGDVPFLRPAELAQDNTRDLPVLQHAISVLRDAGEDYDAVMMLHPTSPLCRADDINACIAVMEDTGADSVMSMVEVTDFAPYKLKIIRDGQIFALLEDEGSEPKPRDASQKIYKRNAAIYLTKTPLILAGDMFGLRSMAYVMPAERSVDINTPFDLKIAECLLSTHAS